VNKITSLILLLPFISACNNEVNTVSYTLPYYSGCEDTLAKVESIFEKLRKIKTINYV